MVRRLLLKSKSMMLFWEWGVYLSCSMMAASLTPCRELLLEVILFLSSAKKLRRHQKENNHSQNPCSSYSWQADIQLTENASNWQKNGKEEAIWRKQIKNSFFHFLEKPTQWPCYLWHCFTSKLTAHSSKLIKTVLTNPNIGNITSKTQWT